MYIFVDDDTPQSKLNTPQQNLNALLEELRELVELQKQSIGTTQRTNTTPLAGMCVTILVI